LSLIWPVRVVFLLTLRTALSGTHVVVTTSAISTHTRLVSTSEDESARGDNASKATNEFVPDNRAYLLEMVRDARYDNTTFEE
jgi:hypothetical protein